jgi:cation diffusion facilitator family transporter
MSSGSRGRSVANESTRTVVVSLGAGLAIALSKAAAAVITGSSAMAAEASHSLADTANDLFLFVAQRRSSQPSDDRYPLGHGREAYFWALIAAIGVFVAGAAFSLREGVDQLVHPSATSSFTVAYAVLAFSTVFDLVSLRQSAGQMRTRGRRFDRAILEEARATSDTTLRAVFNSDVTAVSGDLVAVAALALNQISGSSIPQGIAAVVVGVALILISLRLVRRTHDFLVGAWVLPVAPQEPSAVGSRAKLYTQPIPEHDLERMRALVLGHTGVTAIRQMLFTFLGPSRMWVVARLDIDDTLSGEELKSLVSSIESGMKQASDQIYRVDVVPVGRTQAATLSSAIGGDSATGGPRGTPAT